MSSTQARKWALDALRDSAITIPVINLNLTGLYNVGLCEKKIVALLNARGLDARATGVCSAIELRPSRRESTNPRTWAAHVANVVLENWVSLRRDNP